MDSNKNEDFYKKLVSYKAINKLTNKEIGEVIGMNPDTLRMAVDRRSLNKWQISEISNKYGFSEPNKNSKSILVETDLEVLKDEKKINDLAIFINDNYDALMNNRLFKALEDKRLGDRMNEKLSEMLSKAK